MGWEERLVSIHMVWTHGHDGEDRMVRRVLMKEVSGMWVHGRPKLGWMDGVKLALSSRWMTVEVARQ